jgi:hypothetical protein
VSIERESSASCLYSTNLGDADRRVRESSNTEPSDSLRSDLESDTIRSTQHLAVVQSEALLGSIQRSTNSQNRFFHSLESNSLLNKGKQPDQLRLNVLVTHQVWKLYSCGVDDGRYSVPQGHWTWSMVLTCWYRFNFTCL